MLWHSVMWQYLVADEQAAVSARIAGLGERATEEAPFVAPVPGADPAHARQPHDFLVVLELPADDGERRILGDSVGHGMPTTW